MKVRGARCVVDYRLPVKIAAWCCFALGVLAAYGASRASADQRVIAACVGGAGAFRRALLLARDPFRLHRVRRGLRIHIFSVAKAPRYSLDRYHWLPLLCTEPVAHSKDVRLRFHPLERATVRPWHDAGEVAKTVCCTTSGLTRQSSQPLDGVITRSSSSAKVRDREDAIASTRAACAPPDYSS